MEKYFNCLHMKEQIQRTVVFSCKIAKKYECLAELDVLYGCPRPMFSVCKVASLSLGFSPAREHTGFCWVLVSL